MSRLKILRVNPSLIVDLMNWCSNPKNAVYELPVTETIPEGTTIISIHSEPWCRSLLVTLQHDSFEQVPAGEQIPRIASDSEVVFRRVEFDREQAVETVLQIIRDLPESDCKNVGILIKTLGCQKDIDDIRAILMSGKKA